jgi:putative ABC transport system substrate-binding protein
VISRKLRTILGSLFALALVSVAEAQQSAMLPRIGVVSMGGGLKETRETARSLGLALQLLAVRSPDDFDAAFEAVAKARPSAVITIGHGMFLGYRKRIVDFALKNRLPGVFPEREFVDDGGLMAYGPDTASNFRHAASFVDKILKGAKPAELPIERPTKWGLFVNLRTAKAFGLTIPGSVLVRADEIIQ